MSGPEARAVADGRRSDDERWTILALMLRSAEYLAGKGVESARLDAEYLLAHVLGVGRLEMYMQHERLAAPDEIESFRPLLRRRAEREPLQYILGRQAFRELDLEVGPDVLIPRPETERLVEEVLARSPEPGDGRGLTALDMGTGSGAIALSLLVEGPFERVVGTDVSEATLDVARRNAEGAGRAHALELRLGEYFEPIGDGECFDVVVSNPPYVAESDRAALAPEVKDWEPRRALFGGADGLDAIRVIVAGAGRVLRPGGLLALEVGGTQAREVTDLLREQGFDSVEVRKDLAGKERVVLATNDS